MPLMPMPPMPTKCTGPMSCGNFMIAPASLIPSPLWGGEGVGVERLARASTPANCPPYPPPNKLALGRAQARPGWGREKLLVRARRRHLQHQVGKSIGGVEPADG